MATSLPDDVRSWLQERGYNPFGDLCATKPGSGWTIMHQACDAGALNVCQWLLNNGAGSTIRTKDNEGWTPMFRACECGHLHIAQVTNAVFKLRLYYHILLCVQSFRSIQ